MAVTNCITRVLDVVFVVCDVVTGTKNLVCGTNKASQSPALHLSMRRQSHYLPLAMQERREFSSRRSPAWQREARLDLTLSRWWLSLAAAA